MPMSAAQLEAAKAKRNAMAKKFEVTQNAMSSTVDDLALMKRSAVPYPSTWEGKSIAEHGPIPTDNHLIPSNMVITKKEPPKFKERRGDSGLVQSISGKPWYTHKKAEPIVFEKPGDASASAASGPPPIKIDEEMWRAQYQEWTLQKNAFNPDIAAAMRTNVRKMASLAVVDPTKSVDAARTSENVKAALQCSDVTGPAVVPPKPRVDASNAFPLYFK